MQLNRYLLRKTQEAAVSLRPGAKHSYLPSKLSPIIKSLITLGKVKHA